MRDEASLHRLAEMGVDVYRLRASAVGSPLVVDPHGASSMSAPVRSDTASIIVDGQAINAASVLLLVEIESPVVKRLLADVMRTFKFARIACAYAGARDEIALSTAAGLVMFGEAQAREVGALIPAQRQREIGWIVSAEPKVLAKDAHAKRALWSELRRMTRGLAGVQQRGLAQAAADPDHRKH